MQWGVDIVHGATLEFARHVARSAGKCSPHSDLRQMISELILVWWTLPDLRHARAWGDFPYEDDQSGGYGEIVAAPFSWRGLCPGLSPMGLLVATVADRLVPGIAGPDVRRKSSC